MAHAQSSVPFFLWPFYAIWKVVSFVLVTTGRVVCGVLGLVFMFVGILLTVSIAGAPVGMPLAFVGGLLLVRALF
ncbi:MAG: hypothetical protein ACM3JJ_07135 [Hyphomicrobiales bacterium]